MKRLFILLVLMLSLGQWSQAQNAQNFPPDDKTVVIDSTNLPIVWIDVDGATIQRRSRIGARMIVIHNGDGQLNYGDTVAHPGQHIDYEGYIALRYRGNSTYRLSDKKAYSFRTLSHPLEESDDKKKVDILGMGKDNNWALLAPYSDRSMIRDLLGFEIARPWMEYTPQGRFCEVYLDGVYYGVYIMCEVVSKGKHRLNLDDPGEEGDALTGGYLLEVGMNEGMYHLSKYSPVDNNGKFYTDKFIIHQYKSPDYEDMTWPQINYINAAIDQMEDAFASDNFKDPEEGYRKYIDVMSFLDYQLVMEISHNVDAYRLSGKFYKRRDSIDPRFKMVVWDLNLAFGNARHNQGYKTNTWVYRSNPTLYANGDYMIPFWWYKLRCDNAYLNLRKERWAEWRGANVREDRIMATIDSLANVVTCYGAVERNSQAWPRWGVWVWPNYYVSTDYADEIAFLKDWLTTRIAWMDDQLGYEAPPLPPPPPPVIPKGDVNADYQVNIADVNLLIDIILGGKVDEETMARADVNEDGEITLGDIAAVLDIILDQ